MKRSPDVLDLLAQARPARLDPPPYCGDHAAPAVSSIVADAAATVGHADIERPRKPRRTRMAVLGSAAVTAVAAAAAAVAVIDPGLTQRHTSPDDAPDLTAPAPQATIDARRLLLAAAEHNDKAAPVGGRYLTIQTESGAAVPVNGPGGSYTMFAKSGIQYWLARTSADRSWSMSQSLGAAPATPQDEAAWRRHGSPAVMRVTKPKPFDLRIAPGPIGGNTVDGANLFALGDRNVSQAQLDALPTDPAALREALLSRFDGGGSDLPTHRDQWLRTIATHVVIGLPVSNAVRAGAYRMLASLPGVRGVGAVTDMRGRPGQAIAFVQDEPAFGRFEVRLIIDSDTGQALSRESRAVQPRGPSSWLPPGTLSGYELVLVAKTTDENPPKVAVPN